MREIELTQGKVALVDDIDYEYLKQFKWCARYDGHNWYAARTVLKTNGKMLYIHREILNAPKGIQVDHCNGNGLDNRRENLRLCTNQQNSFNKQARKDNKLGVKGVCWNRKRGKFQSSIQVNGKTVNLGFFNTLEKADSIYRVAEIKYFGEFARNYNLSLTKS